MSSGIGRSSQILNLSDNMRVAVKDSVILKQSREILEVQGAEKLENSAQDVSSRAMVFCFRVFGA